MMGAVQVGHRQHPAQPALAGKLHRRMVKQHPQRDERLVRQDQRGVNAHGHDEKHFDQRAQEHFTDMQPECRGDVHDRVAVMHLVEQP